MLEEVIKTKELGKQYDPRIKNESSRRKAVIPLDLQKAQIIADSLESSLSLVWAWHQVNAHGKTEMISLVTQSVVDYCIRNNSQWLLKQ